MKHNLLMILGCGLPLLLIFLLPAFGLGSGWVLGLAIGAMLACHLMHFGGHDQKDHHDEHQH